MRASKTVWNALITVACLFAVDASAATVSVSGRIQSLYFSGEDNFPVRVFLRGVTDPCGNGGSAYAFIAPGAKSNYNVMAAALMMAKAQNTAINMLVAPDPATPSLCRIIDLSTAD